MKEDAAAWKAFIAANKEEMLAHFSSEIELEAKAAAPVVTGNLRASIRTEREDDSHFVGSDLPYAYGVEVGEHKDGSVARKAGPAAFLRGPLYRKRS